nr:PREDICTED: uncharacterized protein LOC109037607 [Bemisia tabaci]
MNQDITFSLLNFSNPGEVKSLRTKPSSSQFAKLSSTKKKKSSSTKENTGMDNKLSSSRNVSKNLLASYDKSSIKGILREKNNVPENFDLKSKPVAHSLSGSPLKKVTQGEDVVDLVGVKFCPNLDIEDQRKIMLKSKKEENFRIEVKGEYHVGSKKTAVDEKELNSSESQGLCSQKDMNDLKKTNSLSTSFSSLDSSEPRVQRSANRMAPRKLTESIISISSSPENGKSFYESVDSFFPVKYTRTKKLISSTPRCSDAFFSPPDHSGEFESGVSGISKENVLVSKCDLNTSLKTGRAKISFSNFCDGPEKNLTDQSNKENMTNLSLHKRNSLNNLCKDEDDILKNSFNHKFDRSSVGLNAVTKKVDKLDVSSSSSRKTDEIFISDAKLDFSTVTSKKNSRIGNSEEDFNLQFSSTKKNSKSFIPQKKKADDLTRSSKEISRQLSSEEKFDALLKSGSHQSSTDCSASNSLTTKNVSQDNLSQRFKTSDESRIVFDTLKFRGVTVRRHRRQKVLGLQKDFMYDYTSCSSEEEANENYNLPVSKSVSALSHEVDISNNISIPASRSHKSKQLKENSICTSTASKTLNIDGSLKMSTDNVNLSLNSISSSREVSRSKQSLEISSIDLTSSPMKKSSNSPKPRNSSRGVKLDLLFQGSSKVASDSVRRGKVKTKQLLECSKSSLENFSVDESVEDSGKQKSGRNKSSSMEVSQSESLLNAEKLLDELYGTTWHEKKDTILPRSTVKKKSSKQKPSAVSRQTLNFSDDEDDVKKNQKKMNRRKKRDSFINDDSSSSENCDLNFYRTLTNKLTSSSTKLKLSKPSLRSEGLLFSDRKKLSSASSSESLEMLNISSKNKNGGILKKGKVKKSPSFMARKTNVLTSTLSDNKVKKPPIKKLTKSSPVGRPIANDTSSSDSESDSQVKDFKKPIPKKNTAPIKNTPARPELKKFKITPSKAPKGEHSKLSFLASLSATVDEIQSHPDAVPYKKFYKTKKEELARRLLVLYNREVFENQLPDDMLIQWNARMRSTSGYCWSKKVRRTGMEMARVCRIVLSTKILDTPERLRDTLLHELCHAAAWIVNGATDGHGPLWKAWANKAMRRFPEVPPIKRCHDYSIKTKFTYRCTSCGYSIGRHSKSLDTTRKRCGYCYGAFELLVNHSKSNRKSAENLKAPRTPGKFAMFVKENYGEVKKQNLTKTHAEIMKLLGQQFSIFKNQSEKRP